MSEPASTRPWSAATLALVIGLSLGVGCPYNLPPVYYGKLYCFTAEGAYGYNPTKTKFEAIHAEGKPIKRCWCYCYDLHADTQLFGGPDPPPAPQEWLELIAKHRAMAVDECTSTAEQMGLINDNCEDVFTEIPTWEQQDGECGSRPWTDGSYCTEADPMFGDAGSDESGGAAPSDEPPTVSNQLTPP